MVSGSKEQAILSILDNLLEPSDSRDHDRDLAAHGFQRREAERFSPNRRDDDYVAVRVHTGYVLVIEPDVAPDERVPLYLGPARARHDDPEVLPFFPQHIAGP